MALGDYNKTHWNNAAPPPISADNLNNKEDKIKELDEWGNSHSTSSMPHELEDQSESKTYRYGLKQEDGHVVFIYEEVSG